VRQAPPLKVIVELTEPGAPPEGLREKIESDIRATLVVTTAIQLVPPGTLPRSDYKSRLLDFSEATAEALDE
jgi:phenylacetate-CoA ligase